MYGAKMLGLRNTSTGVSVIYSSDGKPREIKADYAICALPPHIAATVPSNVKASFSVDWAGTEYSRGSWVGWPSRTDGVYARLLEPTGNIYFAGWNRAYRQYFANTDLTTGKFVPVPLGTAAPAKPSSSSVPAPPASPWKSGTSPWPAGSSRWRWTPRIPNVDTVI